MKHFIHLFFVMLVTSNVLFASSDTLNSKVKYSVGLSGGLNRLMYHSIGTCVGCGVQTSHFNTFYIASTGFEKQINHIIYRLELTYSNYGTYEKKTFTDDEIINRKNYLNYVGFMPGIGFKKNKVSMILSAGFEYFLYRKMSFEDKNGEVTISVLTQPFSNWWIGSSRFTFRSQAKINFIPFKDEKIRIGIISSHSWFQRMWSNGIVLSYLIN